MVLKTWNGSGITTGIVHDTMVVLVPNSVNNTSLVSFWYQDFSTNLVVSGIKTDTSLAWPPGIVLVPPGIIWYQDFNQPGIVWYQNYTSLAGIVWYKNTSLVSYPTWYRLVSRL